MPKPLHQIVRDLEFASRQGALTPSFIDRYADVNGERVVALYALAAKNFLTVAHEAGRNDHVLLEWESTVDVDQVLRAMEQESAEASRRLREAKADGRPVALRRSSKDFDVFRTPRKAWSGVVAEGSRHRCDGPCTECGTGVGAHRP